MDGPKKRARRVTQACDYCHRRSRRCQPSSRLGTCLNCFEFSQRCTFERQVKRRGNPPAPTAGVPTRHRPDSEKRSGTVRGASGSVHSQSPGDHNISTVREERGQSILRSPRQQASNAEPWQAPSIASQATVMDLVELYFEIVYPIFPLYHEPSFIRSVSRGEYTTQRSLFADTMAVCALVSARVRDRAISNPKWDNLALTEIDPEVFYSEASQQATCDESFSDFHSMRAHAVLSIAAIQHGKIRDMHLHLGRYHTLVAINGLHDEGNWPPGLGVVQREERRRLFWSMYTLDIYTSIVWNGVIRSREQQSNVAYPTEVNDDSFGDNGFSGEAPKSPAVVGPLPGQHGRQIQTSSWLCGWNFVTDLYRILEHVISHLRGRHSRASERSFLYDVAPTISTLSQTSVRNKVMFMYNRLPQCFKETPPLSYVVQKDRFGFQAANIIATVQLLRMVLFISAGASIRERCQIADEVIGAFIAVPVAYLHAISTPLLHHLGGIGAILGSVFEEALTETDYSLVREVLFALAQLLSNLEVKHSGGGTSASERLRTQISKIDSYMNMQRENAAQAQDVREQNMQRSPLHTAINGVVFQQHGSALEDDDQLSQLQIPSNLLDDFMWTFDFAQPDG